MLTSPVLLDLAHDTRQRNAGGASGVMCRVLSLVAAYYFEKHERGEQGERGERAKERDDCRGRTTREGTLSRVQTDTKMAQTRFQEGDPVRQRNLPSNEATCNSSLHCSPHITPYIRTSFTSLQFSHQSSQGGDVSSGVN